MSNVHVTLPFQNESASAMKVLLEPMSEYFIVHPGESIQVHGIFDSQTNNMNFTVAPNDGFLTLYAPGEIAGFVDCYATRNGVRLMPDGN